MAKMGKSMSIASRLAAATALTGTLAACDGRFGRASSELFAPMSSKTPAEAAQQSPAPAAPGNPVYIGGSQAANDALYRQEYGAPIQGSGQSIPEQPTFASSVYQDNTISATPITDIPGGPVIDAGTASPTPAYTLESVGYSDPAPIEPQYSAPAYQTPLPQYNAPVSAPTNGTFPAIGSDPAYLPQSSLPQSSVYQADIFTDASSTDGARDIESLLGTAPEQTVPYGSTASHRYSAAEEITSGAATPAYVAPQYSMPAEMIESTPSLIGFVDAAPIGSTDTVEVAAIGGGYMPMPRSRPERIGPVFEPQAASVAARIPVARPSILSKTPLPTLRPVQVAAVSGKAITDAPALTEVPEMIEVEAIFIDEPGSEPVAEPEIEVAALAPVEDKPKAPEPEAPALTVIKPDDLEKEMASIDTSKVDVDVDASAGIAVASLEESAAPRVEIASDVGDLKELSGTSWRLSTLNGEDVAASAELHFDGTSGFAGGQGICNNYGGEFSETLKGDFEMGNIFSTETECENFGLEKKYIVALESASKYRMAPGLKELMLIGPGGKTIATFAAF